MTSQYNIELYKSRDLSASFTINDSNSAAIDITGYTVTLSVCSARTATPDFTITGTLTTPVSGICTFAIAPSNTSGLTYKDGQVLFSYLEVTDASAKKSIIEGNVTFKTV